MRWIHPVCLSVLPTEASHSLQRLSHRARQWQPTDSVQTFKSSFDCVCLLNSPWFQPLHGPQLSQDMEHPAATVSLLLFHLFPASCANRTLQDVPALQGLVFLTRQSSRSLDIGGQCLTLLGSLGKLSCLLQCPQTQYSRN